MKKHIIAALMLFGFGQIFAQNVPNPFVKSQKQPVSQIQFKASNSPKLYSSKTERCYTVDLYEKQQALYNLPVDSIFELNFAAFLHEHNNNAHKKADDIYYIPVIVHIIHNGENVGVGANISQAQVLSQIKILNEDFRRIASTPGYNNHKDGADVRIEFVLALRDENGNTLSEAGIHRVDGNKSSWESEDVDDIVKPQTVWDPTKYMNIWVVNFGGNSADLLGYAQFPSLSGLGGLDNNGGLAKTDGVVIKHQAFGNTGTVQAPYNGGRTATHEVGHWLGLRHIWGDGDCYQDDYCDDTPRAADANYDCKKTNSCTKFAGNDMIENYMDYTPDGCMNIFTIEQKARMRTVMENCPRRKELLVSDVAKNTGTLPLAFFSANKTEICEGATIEFFDNSLNNPTSWTWRFFDANTNQTVGIFTSQNPKITFNRIGIYGLSLVVGNGSGLDSLVDSNYVAVLSSSEQTMPYIEDFESLNTFEDWVLYNPENDRTWSETSNAAASGDWALVFDNYSLDTDPSGTLDAIFSPVIDLAKYKDAYLSFDIAYARYSKEYSDTLAFYITDDCGESYYILWQKGGDDLATANDTFGAFTPSQNQWVNERVYLGDYAFLGKIHIAIINFSGWGNNIYIDNLELFVPSYSAKPQAFFWTPKDTVTVGSTVVYGDYSNNYPSSWSWVFEGAIPNVSTNQTPTVVYDKPGTFDVKLTAANKAGSDIYNVPNYITVVAKPNISIKSNKPSFEICQEDSIMLVASGAINYEWYDERGTLLAMNDTVVVKPFETSTYTVKGIDRYDGSNLLLKEIQVEPKPVVNLGNDTTIDLNAILLFKLLGSYSSIKWHNNATEPNYTFTAADFGLGTHAVFVQVSNQKGCINTDTIFITVKKATSTFALGENEEMRVYPNPSNGQFTIEFSELSQEMQVRIYSANGLVVFENTVHTKSDQIVINGLASGIYFVECRNAHALYVKRISVIE